MIKIFISYRRADTGVVAGRLYEVLADIFGAENIFLDIHNQAYGVNFRGVVMEYVTRCNLILVLIGRDWLTVTESDGLRRIDNEDDMVHVEVETALNRDTAITIPVLVDDTSMPRRADLTPDLHSLLNKQAVRLSSHPLRFKHDVKGLLKYIRHVAPVARHISKLSQMATDEMPALDTDAHDDESEGRVPDYLADTAVNKRPEHRSRHEAEKQSQSNESSSFGLAKVAATVVFLGVFTGLAAGWMNGFQAGADSNVPPSNVASNPVPVDIIPAGEAAESDSPAPASIHASTQSGQTHADTIDKPDYPATEHTTTAETATAVTRAQTSAKTEIAVRATEQVLFRAQPPYDQGEWLLHIPADNFPLYSPDINPDDLRSGSAMPLRLLSTGTRVTVLNYEIMLDKMIGFLVTDNRAPPVIGRIKFGPLPHAYAVQDGLVLYDAPARDAPVAAQGFLAQAEFYVLGKLSRERDPGSAFDWFYVMSVDGLHGGWVTAPAVVIFGSQNAIPEYERE